MGNYYQDRNAGRNDMKPDIYRLEKENNRLKTKLEEAVSIITYYSKEIDNGLKAKNFLENYEK